MDVRYLAAPYAQMVIAYPSSRFNADIQTGPFLRVNRKQNERSHT